MRDIRISLQCTCDSFVTSLTGILCCCPHRTVTLMRWSFRLNFHRKQSILPTFWLIAWTTVWSLGVKSKRSFEFSSNKSSYFRAPHLSVNRPKLPYSIVLSGTIIFVESNDFFRFAHCRWDRFPVKLATGIYASAVLYGGTGSGFLSWTRVLPLSYADLFPFFPQTFSLLSFLLFPS